MNSIHFLLTPKFIVLLCFWGVQKKIDIWIGLKGIGGFNHSLITPVNIRNKYRVQIKSSIRILILCIRLFCVLEHHDIQLMQKII